ncbi:MAG: lysophospholipid acyltransferase family protein [Acidobacteriota bacterium]
MRPVQDYLVYLLVRVFFAKIGWLPRPLASLVCRGMASLIFLFDQKHRRIGMTNLQIAFPERDPRWRSKVLLRSFQSLGELAVEFSRITRLGPDEVASRVPYEVGRGVENYLRAKRDSTTGVLFITGHLSAWELLPAAHALHGHPLSFVVRPLDNPYIERWVSGLRSRFGNRTISKHRALRSILSTLKAGGDVGFLIDQNTQEKEGHFAPFFGKPACTTSVVASLALRTGAPVVPGFICPGEKKGHYRIRFYPPLYFQPGGKPDQDLAAATAAMNRSIEDVVRDFPHCWLWGHRRFATQPDGSDPYR